MCEGQGKRTVMRGKTVKRIWAVALAAAMGMSLMACNNETSSNAGSDSVVGEKVTTSNDENSQYVYIADFQNEALLSDTDDSWVSSMDFQENGIIYNKVVFDEEKNVDVPQICYRDFNELSKEEAVNLPAFSLDGYETHISTFCCDTNNNYYVFYELYLPYVEGEEYDYNQNKTYFIKYDSNGNQMHSLDLSTEYTDENNSYVRDCMADPSGKVYAAANNVIYVIGPDGAFQKSIFVEADYIVDLFGTEDGRVFLSYFDTANGFTTKLAEINTKENSLGQVLENLPEYDVTAKCGVNGKLYLIGMNDLYEYDLATQAATKLLNWVDCSLLRDCVQNIKIQDNGDLLLLYSNYEGDSGLVTLKKTLKSEVVEKKEIVLGTLFSGNSDIESSVIRFNKKSDKYKVVFKYYLPDDIEWTENTYSDAIALMNADLIGNNPPDIIHLGDVNYESLAKKGILEDLGPYLDASTVLNRSDFVESVLNAYTINDKLITIPVRFRLSSIAAKSSLVGKNPGWTLDEMIALADSYPNSDLFFYAEPEYILRICMQYGNNSFIDYENGTCNFNSPEFVKLLEFSKRFKDMKLSMDRNQTDLIRENKVLLSEYSFSDVYEIQLNSHMFGEEVTMIGYPTSDGSAGVFVEGIDNFAIVSSCDNKEGAWSFLENVFTDNTDEMYYYGFPTKVKDLEAAFEESMKPEYALDEFGNKVVDENGEYIQIPIMTIGFDNEEVDIYTVTKEEIAFMRSLIDMAQPISNNDEAVYSIIMEEAAAFFKGQKTAEDVAKIIQSRVDVYVSENS